MVFIYLKKCEKTCAENFHWPYTFTTCVLTLHAAVSVGRSMFYTEVLDPVLAVTRICRKQWSEGSVLNFHLLGGKSTWVAAVSSCMFSVSWMEMSSSLEFRGVPELKSTISLQKSLNMVHFGFWIEAAHQWGSPEPRHTDRTAQPVMSWGYPKLYLSVEISVPIEIRDFSTFTLSSGGEFMKNQSSYFVDEPWWQKEHIYLLPPSPQELNCRVI